MKIKPLKINTSKGARLIGPGYPVFIIAEISGNHNQSFDRAVKIIDAAVEAGVDAIKSQTYTADTITFNCDNKFFQIKSSNPEWNGLTLHGLYKKAYTPWNWQPKLKKYAEKRGILFFSTPFDPTAVDFLEGMDTQLYKVASPEVVDIPLLERIGRAKKPVIMSRGMSSVKELELAVKTLKDNGAPQVAILHCVSSYPAKPEQMNLATIPDIIKRFNTVSGLSDHTLGITVPIASIAIGASIIEKHITLARADGGPDAAFSLEPAELKQLVQSIRAVEKAIGKPSYKSDKDEVKQRAARKSLFAVKNIKKGEMFTKGNVRSIRPGHGLLPKYYYRVMGQIAQKDIKSGTPLSWGLIKRNK